MNVRFPSTPEGINEFLDKIEPLGAASVVMDATRFCMYINDIVEARGYDVKVAHPSKVKALTAGRAKADKNDAEMLAALLRLGAIPESYIPPRESRELREMTRVRQSLVGRSVDLRNEIHAVLAARGLRPPTGLRASVSKMHVRWLRTLRIVQVDDMLDLPELVESKVVQTEEGIQRMCQKDEDIERLKTIPGVGDVTATSFCAEIGDIARFSSPEKLASYVGLTTIIRQSGGSKGWSGPISKHGNARLRRLLWR